LKNTITITKNAPSKIKAKDLGMGQMILTSTGAVAVRSESGVTFLSDGSGSAASLEWLEGELLPIGTEITIKIQR